MSSLPDDAIARAKAIAAKLTASLGSSAPEGGAGGAGGTKRRWGEGEDGPRKTEKVFIPTDNPEFNFFSLLVGPRGSTQKRLQETTGAHINIRGHDKGGDPAADGAEQEEMHVLIEGTEEQVTAAKAEVEKILFDPEEAQRLKAAQLRNLAEMKGGGVGAVGYSGAASGEDGHYGPPRPKPGIGFGGAAGAPAVGGGGGGLSAGDATIATETSIPATLVGLMIGRGGENIQRLTALTGCFVQVAKETIDNTRVVTIKGPSQEQVNECLKLVQDQVETAMNAPGGLAAARSAPASAADYNYAASLQVPVPHEKVGLIIGRGGSTIKDIQNRTGATVKIPPAEPGDAHRTVTITATNMPSAEAARNEIHALLTAPGGGPGGPIAAPVHNGTALIMHIGNDKVGLIIGRAGANIKEIQYRTGTRVQIPPEPEPGSNPPVRAVTITGPGDGPERARYEIETKLMNEGCRDPHGNYIPYQPSPAFIVPIGPGGVPVMPGTAPPAPPTSVPPQGYYGNAGPPPQQPPPQQPQYGAPPPGYPQQPHQPDPYAAYGQYQMQQPQAPYQQQGAYPPPPQQQAPAPAPAPVQAPAPAPATSNGAAAGGDATYHEQFWQYAQHYGTAFAREKYGTWAPPEGTPVPPNITLPTPEAAAAAIASLAK